MEYTMSNDHHNNILISPMMNIIVYNAVVRVRGALDNQPIASTEECATLVCCTRGL